MLCVKQVVEKTGGLDGFSQPHFIGQNYTENKNKKQLKWNDYPGNRYFQNRNVPIFFTPRMNHPIQSVHLIIAKRQFARAHVLWLLFQLLELWSGFEDFTMLTRRPLWVFSFPELLYFGWPFFDYQGSVLPCRVRVWQTFPFTIVVRIVGILFRKLGWKIEKILIIKLNFLVLIWTKWTLTINISYRWSSQRYSNFSGGPVGVLVGTRSNLYPLDWRTLSIV